MVFVKWRSNEIFTQGTKEGFYSGLNKEKRWSHWVKQRHPTPVLLPEKSHGRRSLVGCIYGVAQSQTQLKRLSSSSSKVSKDRSFCKEFTPPRTVKHDRSGKQSHWYQWISIHQSLFHSSFNVQLFERYSCSKDTTIRSLYTVLYLHISNVLNIF